MLHILAFSLPPLTFSNLHATSPGERLFATQFTLAALFKPHFTWESELEIHTLVTLHTLTCYLWINAVCQINLCLTSLLLDPSASLLSAPWSLLFPLLLPSPFPLSLAPFTQMLPAAQLDRSDGMCQLGITPIPTFLHCKQGEWLGGKEG